MFIVMTASARMPGSCWGRYGRVAVVEIDPEALREGDTKPRMISTHARGVMRIVQTWERCNIGRTEACAFRRACAEAEQLAAELNAQKADTVWEALP